MLKHVMGCKVGIFLNIQKFALKYWLRLEIPQRTRYVYKHIQPKVLVQRAFLASGTLVDKESKLDV